MCRYIMDYVKESNRLEKFGEFKKNICIHITQCDDVSNIGLTHKKVLYRLILKKSCWCGI